MPVFAFAFFSRRQDRELLADLFTMSSAMIWAGCISDCKDEYDSDVKSCKSQYDDPEDADDLQQDLIRQRRISVVHRRLHELTLSHKPQGII